MNRRDEIELLAEFLNTLCVDWPPISVNWSGKGRLFSFRRREMLELARKFVIDRELIEETE